MTIFNWQVRRNNCRKFFVQLFHVHKPDARLQIVCSSGGSWEFKNSLKFSCYTKDKCAEKAVKEF